MDEIYELIKDNVNILYIFLCNLITYLIIDGIENGGSKKRKITRNKKRLISTVSAIFIGFCMLCLDDTEDPEDLTLFRLIFYGFFIQFLTWDYCFKGIINYLKSKFGTNNTKTSDVEDEHQNQEENNSEE